jgi:ankyrin repeat protein
LGGDLQLEAAVVMLTRDQTLSRVMQLLHALSANPAWVNAGLPERVRRQFQTGRLSINESYAHHNQPLGRDDRAPALVWSARINFKWSDEAMELLLGMGADPNVADSGGCYPLSVIVTNYYIDADVRLRCAKRLVDAGALLSNRGVEDDQSALYEAVDMGDTEMVSFLLESGADVTPSDELGWTPLHLACKLEFAHAVSELLFYGADPNVKDEFGATPLMVLALFNQPTPNTNANSSSIAQMLIDNGAELHHIVTSDADPAPDGYLGFVGFNALQIARSFLSTDPPVMVGLAKMLLTEETFRAQGVAFAMGHHERLGATSRVLGLDAGIVRMVLEEVRRLGEE